MALPEGVCIDWSAPRPRAGLRGRWDRLVGPGASRAEQLLAVTVGLLAAVAVTGRAVSVGVEWSVSAHIVAALIALDVAGGVVTNATPSAKRWFHSGDRARKASHLGFSALHGVHVAVVAWVFTDAPPTYFAAVWGYLLAATALTLTVPWRLQRPAAQAAVAGTVFAAPWALPAAPGWGWFPTLLVLKLVAGHVTLEVPLVDAPGTDVRPGPGD